MLVYSDASSVACGAFVVKATDSVFDGTFTHEERRKSSTWRELKAIELAIKCHRTLLERKTVKWFTDSQCCAKISDSGSMKDNNT